MCAVGVSAGGKAGNRAPKPASVVPVTGSRTLTSLEKEREEAQKLLEEVVGRSSQAHRGTAAAAAVKSPSGTRVGVHLGVGRCERGRGSGAFLNFY